MTPDFRFDPKSVDWTRLQGGPEFDYPIDYEVAVMGYQEDAGTLGLLVRFAPKSYCHFHRHVAATTTLVLEGEQHVYDVGPGGDVTHKVRPAGTYAYSPGGDLHMECGGPDGATVFFGLQSPTGHLFDLLDKEHNVIGQNTIQNFAEMIAELS